MMGDEFPRPLVFAVLFLGSLHLTISILLRKGPTLLTNSCRHPSFSTFLRRVSFLVTLLVILVCLNSLTM